MERLIIIFVVGDLEEIMNDKDHLLNAFVSFFFTIFFKISMNEGKKKNMEFFIKSLEAENLSFLE
jgi:hypothetical protein